MAGETVRINVPFEALLDSISRLSTEEKMQLRASLDDQIDALGEERPEIEAEVREARKAYEAGNYTTIDEYLEHRR